jgi:hypothetical protein
LFAYEGGMTARARARAGGTPGSGVLAVRAPMTAYDDGIRRGDVLLVRPAESAPPGATVVVLVDGRPTVRRLVRGARGERQLLPVSPHVLPLVLPAERARILGSLVGVVRDGGRDATAPPVPDASPAADSALRLIGAALDEASRAAAADRRIGDAARDLRALRDAYARTSAPKLRRALLREAEARAAALRGMLPPRVPAERVRPSFLGKRLAFSPALE